MPLPEMHPVVRAIADRLIWEGAVLELFAGLLPESADGRPAGDGEWTVRQLFAHMAIKERLHADNLERYLRGEVPRPPGFQVDAWNAETVAAARDMSFEDILSVLESERARLFAMFATLGEDDLEREFIPGRPLLAAITAWSGHYVEHGFDLIEAVPELNLEPIVVTWLARAELPPDSPLANRQQALVTVIRAELARLDAESAPDDA